MWGGDCLYLFQKETQSIFYQYLSLQSGDVMSLLTHGLCFSLTLLRFIVVLFQALTLNEISALEPTTIYVSELIFFFFFKDQTAPEPANLFTLLGLTVYSDLIWYGQKDGSNNINMGVPAYLLQIICLFRDTYVKHLKFC